MSGIDYSEFVSGLDEAGVSHGQVSGEPLPAGWYPMTVRKAEVVAAKSGLPMLKLQLQVTGDAPKGAANRVAFAQLMLAAKRTSTDNGIETMKSEADYKKDSDVVKAKLNGFLVAVGVSKQTPNAPKDSLEYIGQTINVAAIEGATFMGRLKVDRSEQFGDRNSLEEFYGINDPKKGLAQWREQRWGLQKLTAALAVAGNSGSASGGGTTGLHTL